MAVLPQNEIVVPRVAAHRAIHGWTHYAKRLLRLAFKRREWAAFGCLLRLIKKGQVVSQHPPPDGLILVNAVGYNAWMSFALRLWRLAFKRREWSAMGAWLREIKGRLKQ